MKRFAIITGILSGFLFGIATLFSKLLLNGLNSFQLAGLLYLGLLWQCRHTSSEKAVI